MAPFWRVFRWAMPLLGLALVISAVVLVRRSRTGVPPAPIRGSASSRAAVLRGRDLLNNGHPQLAIQAVSGIRAGDPEEGRAFTVRGLALASLNQLEESRHALERGWKLAPEPMAAKVLAALYLTSREPARALQMLHAAANLDPSDFRPWYAIGDTYLRLDRPEEAIKAFREALKRLPESDEARIGLIDALLRTSQTAEAAPLLDAVRKTHPDDTQVLLLAALHARASGHVEDAARLIDQSLEQDPDNRRALLLRAQLFHLAGRADRALRDAERAVALDPSDPAALHELALLEAASGLKDRAAATSAKRKAIVERLDKMQQLAREIEERPRDPEPHYQLGRLAAEAGVRPLAVESYRAALALDPGHQASIQALRELGEPIARRPERYAVPAPSASVKSGPP